MELFSIFGRILLKDDGVENKLSSITEKAQQTEGSFSGSFEKMKNGALKLGATLLGGLGIGALIKKSYELAQSASDLNEAQNVVENTFKKSAKSIEAWTNTTAKSAGISKTASTQWSGFMGAMLKSSGVTENASASMSKNLVQLTGDMSSFYNISTSDMWEKIRSGISGETMPLKQLGINMSEANLSAYALSQGITKSYKSMSQAEQTTLRYNYLLSVTKDAQGDFGRTLSTSFANQMRVAELNMKTLGQTIGNVLLPPFMKLVTLFNENAPKVQTFLDNLTKNTGKIAPMAAIFAGVAASLIPILGTMGKTSDSIEKLRGKFEKFHKSYEEGTTKIQKYGNAFKDLGSKIGDLNGIKKLQSGFETLQIKGLYAFDALKNGITTKLQPLGTVMSGMFNKLPSGLTGTFSKITGALGAELPKINSVFKTTGSIMMSGLKTLMSIGFKAIAPASIIATVLLGLGLLQNTMGDKIDSICKTLIEKGPAMIQKFAAKLTSQIPQMIQAGVTLLNSFINVLIANAPALIKAAVAIITSLINGLATNLPRLIPEIIQLIQTILTAIVDNLPTIINAGLKIIVALAQGIANNMPQIVDAIVKVVQEIIKVVIQNLPTIVEAGIKIIVALIQGLAQATPQLIAALPSIVKAIWDGLKSADWGGLGTAIIQGIGAGIKAAAGGLWNTAKAVGSDILKGFKSMFGIHSPSTVMRDQVGKNISLGIAAGIKDVNFMKAISDVIENSGTDVSAATKKITDLVSNKVKNLKDNLSKQTVSLNAQLKREITKLNTELNSLSSSETKALRSVKTSSARYRIEDNYAAKKNAVKKRITLYTEKTKKEIALRTSQTNKEIEAIKKVGEESKTEITKEIEDRKTAISDINNLFSKVKEALKDSYEDAETQEENNINKLIKANNKWKDNALDNLEKVYNAKKDELSKEETELDRSGSDEDDVDKEAELRKQLSMHYGAEKKKELQEELNDLIKTRDRRHQKEQLEDQKSALESQYNTDKANVEKTAQTNEDNYNKQLENVKNFYTEKQKEANIDAEAQKLIVNNNQTEIVSLLKSYGQDYEIAGASLGDRLVSGFKNALSTIPDMISSITSQLNTLDNQNIDIGNMGVAIPGTSILNTIYAGTATTAQLKNNQPFIIQNHLYMDSKEIAAATAPHSNKIQGADLSLVRRGL